MLSLRKEMTKSLAGSGKCTQPCRRRRGAWQRPPPDTKHKQVSLAFGRLVSHPTTGCASALKFCLALKVNTIQFSWNQVRVPPVYRKESSGVDLILCTARVCKSWITNTTRCFLYFAYNFLLLPYSGSGYDLCLRSRGQGIESAVWQ